MNRKLTFLSFLAVVLAFPIASYAGSACSAKMYKHLSGLDTENNDAEYWNKAKARARAICKECEDVKQCIAFVNSVNKNTSKFQVLGMLNRIEDLQDYDIEDVRQELNYSGPDIEPEDNPDTFVEF